MEGTPPIEEKTKPGLPRRIVAYPLTLAVLGFVWLLLCYAGAAVVARKIAPALNSPIQPLIALTVSALGIAAYLAFKRWVERAPAPELALAGAGRELALGLAAGFAIFSGATGLVALLGGFEVLGLRGVGELWAMLSVAILSGCFEELLFRGILLRLIERVTGPWIALAITSALFGAAHLANPGSSPFAALAIALEAGVLLGAAYFLTRRLWLAMGVHAGWNFTQGWVFSIPVSGGHAPLGLLITRRVGPEWLTGGDFGLEASAPAMIVATVAGVLLLRRAFAANRPFLPA